MTDSTIFTADQAAVPPVTPVVSNPDVAAAAVAPVTQPLPVIPPELAGLVGEGMKFKTIEDAHKALPHQVSHISKIELENSQMREELTKRKTAAELLEDMRKNEPAPVTPGVEVNANVVSEIVKQQIASQRQEEVQTANVTTVTDAFRSNFKEKAEEIYNKVAAENGMSVADMNALSMRSPAAVLNLAKIAGKQIQPSSAFQSGVNTQAILNTNQPPAANSRVANFGKSSDITDGMRRAKEIVAQKLNS